MHPRLQLAALRWYAATGLWPPGGIRLFFEDLERNVAGFAEEGRVVVDPERDEEWLQTIIDHEVGHHLAGIYRGHSVRGLLHPQPEPDAPITEEDLDLVCGCADCLWRYPEVE